MNPHRSSPLYLLPLFCFLVISCGNQIAGGIGHEGEAKIVGCVRYEKLDSIPAGASVYIHPKNYICTSVKDQKNRVPETVVDDSGYFQIDGVLSGDYIIEINDGHRNASAIRCEITPDKQIVKLPLSTLEPSGTACGKLLDIADTASEVRLQILGLDRIAVVNMKTGSFSLQDIPAGTFLLIATQSPSGFVSAVDSVYMRSGETTFVECKMSDDGTVKVVSKKLILDMSATGAAISDNLYDFPVLIRLNRENFDFGSARENGSDLYFTGKDNALLPHEIEYFNSDEMEAAVWVLLDTVYGSQDTQFVNMHWGQNLNAGEGNWGVFDTASGFQCVWHFSEPEGDTLKDATANNFFGIFSGTDERCVTGRIGNTRAFDGTSNYITMPSTADSKLNFPENGIYTISAWVYLDTLDNRYREIVSKSNQLYGLQVSEANLVEFYEYSVEDAWNSNSAPITSREWHFLTAVRNGEEQYLYVDGICVDSTTTVYGGIRKRVLTEALCIGNRVSTSESGFFKGYIDEVRICSRALSAEWIKLSFINQSIDDKLVKFR
ncbi:MAG: hypothetical protein GX556_19685 [Fibrobacter sp.]|nr:hypothetical protein [Fibrobacter sp.]